MLEFLSAFIAGIPAGAAMFHAFYGTFVTKGTEGELVSIGWAIFFLLLFITNILVGAFGFPG